MIRKIILASIVFAVMCATHTKASETIKIENLYGQWCLYGMSLAIDGEKVPDNANYEFTKKGMLNYQLGLFKQSGKYSVDGDHISTKDMGNYRILSLKKDEMILKYGGFMFFKKGKCK